MFLALVIYYSQLITCEIYISIDFLVNSLKFLSFSSVATIVT